MAGVVAEIFLVLVLLWLFVMALNGLLHALGAK